MMKTGRHHRGHWYHGTIGAMASAHVGDGHPMAMFGFAVTEH
jgi:hypothetical protein